MRPSHPPALLHQLLAYPDARIKLLCGSCTWSRTYSAQRIAERLREKRLDGVTHAIADIARHVPWPCPGCRRMRWGTIAAPPVRSRTQRLENPIIPPRR
jgi:hypothetical protein